MAEKTFVRCACRDKFCKTFIEIVDNDLIINEGDDSIGIILTSKNINKLINMLVELRDNSDILNQKRLGYADDGSKFGDE